MKVLNFLRPENGLTEDPLYYFDFKRFETIGRDCYFFLADFYDSLYSGQYDDKEKVVLTLEEPNFCTVDSPKMFLHDKADLILTICPYTAELFDNRTLVFFPFNEELIPIAKEKEIDICYFGSFPRSYPWHQYMNNVVYTYNYRYGHYNAGNMRGCTYAEKIDTMSRSKITLVHGLCNVDNSIIQKYRNFIHGNLNNAFNFLENGMLPQVKSRMFEAAFCRSLILCQKDPWNPIEYFFEPNKEFIYFNDENELKYLIDHITNNFEDYQFIISNAYERAINNYTTKHFVERFLS
jgi:hypothetical protein